VTDSEPEGLRERAATALAVLRGACSPEQLANAKGLVERLRNERDYALMARLAEAISRRDPKDARNRRLYAQCLIETGNATVAVDLLKTLVQRLSADDPELAEAMGLLGRAHKQIFCDAEDKAGALGRRALRNAIAAYRKLYERDPARHTWHGVNLMALLSRARRLGLPVPDDLPPAAVAAGLVADLEAVPAAARDEWHLPTLAEAALGLGDWDKVEATIQCYAAADNAKAFLIASTLRQFTEIWDLAAQGPRGDAIVDILRARLAMAHDGALALEPAEVRALHERPAPDAAQLEAVLGQKGPETYRWWRTGLDRALSVAAVYLRNGDRVGTAFAVRAGDFGLAPGEELLLLTNFHVVNDAGAGEGFPPEAVEIAFEAVEAAPRHLVRSPAVWSSPPDRHDAALLRPEQPVAGVTPLPLARALPLLESDARVYIVGHPGGGALAFSFQDNELLDHEGPPGGNPPIDGVCRVHYRAPTEGGSSGSPVFNGKLWEVIALHHAGGRLGMARLNGRPGTYAANEGLSIAAIRAELARRG
jgi:hypothetical protein